MAGIKLSLTVSRARRTSSVNSHNPKLARQIAVNGGGCFFGGVLVSGLCVFYVSLKRVVEDSKTGLPDRVLS